MTKQEESDKIAETLKNTPERIHGLCEFIDKKLKKTSMFNKYGLTLMNSNDIIIASLMGELRNMVLSFFKDLFKNKQCESCKTTTASQYDRAHDRSLSREYVAMEALRRIRPDGVSHIQQKDFLRAFIEEHKNHPLWYLCRSCHRKYDKM